MLSLDTHILIHALEGRLTPRERQILSGNLWSISAIVLWELSMLFRLGRIGVDIASPEFAVALAEIRVWPLDLAVCKAIRELDFRGDPADDIIAATSLVHNVPLVTRDRRIRGSKRVPLA
jgi:PIN domain nuclease of toxin-antitoxin system